MQGILAAFLVLGLVMPGAPPPGDPAAATSDLPAPDNYHRQHRAVSTQSTVAQADFDDGLTLLYAYNPEQARVSFQHALEADSSLAMAWWGVAESYGTNINMTYDAGDAARGRDAIARAQSADGVTTPAERALIEATTARFTRTGSGDGAHNAQAYRDAIARVADRFPDDDDVQTLAAEAELNTHPWEFFGSDGKPVAGTLDAIARLRTVLARDPGHIGAEHFLIHATEESPHPEDALAAARTLAAFSLEPGAEHLLHMPAHTFERTGFYHEAGEANRRAVDAYRRYLTGAHAGHTDYWNHDCKFGVTAFMMSGESLQAQTLAEVCRSKGPDFEPFIALRFGRWAELQAAQPSDLFAKGMLEAHEASLEAARHDLVGLQVQSSDVARVESDVLEARIARAQGDSAKEIAALKQAVAHQDDMGYSEPPRFWYPVRESLGAAYVRAGKPAEATAIFRDELAHDPGNARAYFGLAEALARAGDSSGATATREKFKAAWANADAQLTLGEL